MSDRVKRFRTAAEGNFAAMFAIALVPLLTGVGMVVDFTNLSRQQSHLQNAVDSAILMSGAYHREHGALPSTAQVEKWLRSNDDTEVQIKDFRIVDNEIYLLAQIETDPLLLDIVNVATKQQLADATVPLATNETVEIALVLDNTGSMAIDGKLDSLKTIATSFVNDALDEAPPGKPDAVKIGLVPFARYVNVGMSNRNSSWMDVPPDETTTSCYMTRDVLTKSGCTTSTHTATSTTDTGTSTYTYTSESCTNYTYGPDYEVCNTNTNEWHGCVGSRPGNLAVSDNGYGNRIPGLLGVTCSTPILPLTNSRSALVSDIAAFTASDLTYIGAGAVWGHRILSRHAPFTQAEPYGDKVRKFMIIMSDGDNTVAPDASGDNRLHISTDLAYSDQLTRQACQNARDNDIEIYTIAFGTSITTAGKAVLQACATDLNNYFVASDAADLARSFRSILANIFTVRLTS